MEMATARDRLVDSLVANEIITKQSTADAVRAVPRHEFVGADQQEQAYQDRPLPIGNDQTISAPHIVGQMLDLIAVEPGDRVLEIGTGCGYHAAVTAEVVGDGNVYSVEYDRELGEAARERLADLGYDVSVRIGDGRKGWPEHAPFDASYLTCAATEPPSAVLEQTATDGVVVGPFGAGRQELKRLSPQPDGTYESETIAPVRFVPMR
ncbi:protein-L-isoaspartate(D-aspartate) O-methyltransferase [Halonotius terrestris]|uniref:Protein-L-isoaspartate O-methyltransferase n=1 Tax=Halonotius terrestris TaxID=2487750 RepID=A0A8J8PCI1_9EURY|nr:protein-L-isoaspartate(D-aspartate) O-methyltransferase [Halonotius terrestris]TQQ81313.1 protein-L-isoaspartate(D-aspartate) O-methyltransferase [Halonotius terrestris]